MKMKLLLVLPTIFLTWNSTANVIKQGNNNNTQINLKEKNNRNFFKGLDLIKQEILNFSTVARDRLINSNETTAYEMFSQHIAEKYLHFLKSNSTFKNFYVGEDKTLSRWYWFGYWRWYATWAGFIDTLNQIPGIFIDVNQGWEIVKPLLLYGIIKYLGAVNVIPVVGWIATGVAATLAASIIGAFTGHQLWKSPQREQGIVMSFYITVYAGSWKQIDD